MECNYTTLTRELVCQKLLQKKERKRTPSWIRSSRSSVNHLLRSIYLAKTLIRYLLVMSMHKQSIYFYAKTSYTNFKQDTAKGNRFLELAKKYINFSKLTTPMLNKFINRIIVRILTLSIVFSRCRVRSDFQHRCPFYHILRQYSVRKSRCVFPDNPF